MAIKQKHMFGVSVTCLSIYFFIMVASEFSLSESLVFFETLEDLLVPEESIIHKLYTIIFRTIMPFYLFPVFYFLNVNFFSVRKLSHYTFYFSSMMLFFYNLIIYCLGISILLIIKHLAVEAPEEVKKDIFSHLDLIFQVTEMLLNDVMNAIQKPCFEVLRGLSLIFIFKSFKINKYYLFLGGLILLLDVFAISAAFLSFLDFEFAYTTSIDLSNFAMIGFQYWLFSALAYLVYKKRKFNQAAVEIT